MLFVLQKNQAGEDKHSMSSENKISVVYTLYIHTTHTEPGFPLCVTPRPCPFCVYSIAVTHCLCVASCVVLRNPTSKSGIWWLSELISQASSTSVTQTH